MSSALVEVTETAIYTDGVAALNGDAQPQHEEVERIKDSMLSIKSGAIMLMHVRRSCLS